MNPAQRQIAHVLRRVLGIYASITHEDDVIRFLVQDRDGSVRYNRIVDREDEIGCQVALMGWKTVAVQSKAGWN